MADEIVVTSGGKPVVTNLFHWHDSRDSDSDSNDDDDDGFRLPGDFGSTLFQVTIASLVIETNQVFEDFCIEAKAACEAAAKEGEIGVKCTCPLRYDVGVRATFLEKLVSVFRTAGVSVVQEVPRTYIIGDGAAGAAAGEDMATYVFNWAALDGRTGFLAELDMDHMVAIKAARGDHPYERIEGGAFYPGPNHNVGDAANAYHHG